ncbi:MAG: hypothetical protein ABQ298_14580 [Puniceicoccaceae bacterium]
MSLAKLIRLALEKVLPGYPRRNPVPVWKLPVIDLATRKDPFAKDDWREALHMENAFVEGKEKR